MDIQVNRSAFYEYEVISSLEVGIELQSYEIKQITNKLCNIRGSFAKIINNEVYLFDMHVQRFDNAVFYINIDEKRPRKLLLHKRQIKKLHEELKLNQSYTLVPLKIYTNDNGKCKIELALAKGKKEYQKKESIKQKDIQKQLRRDDV